MRDHAGSTSTKGNRMKFMLSWQLHAEAKMDALAAFSQMTPEDDAGDHGPDITIIGRWHDLPSGSGVCILESDSAEAVGGSASLHLGLLASPTPPQGRGSEETPPTIRHRKNRCGKIGVVDIISAAFGRSFCFFRRQAAQPADRRRARHTASSSTRPDAPPETPPHATARRPATGS